MKRRRFRFLLWAAIGLLPACGVIIIEPMEPAPSKPGMSWPSARVPAAPEAVRPGDGETIHSSPRTGEEDARSAQHYVEAVNAGIAAADALHARGELAGAGRAYRHVLDILPHTRPLAGRIHRTRDDLTKNLNVCAERLMENGLAEYRLGRLEKALNLWKEILTFAPDHADARKAVETTSRQLKTLHTLPGS